MTKVYILLISVLLSSLAFSQQIGKSGENKNTCNGAINIFENGEFTIAFNDGSDYLTSAYPTLAEIDSKNTLWFSYIAPSAGTLSFDAFVDEGYLQMVIFKPETDDICADIANGISEMQRVLLSKDNQSVGLSRNVSTDRLYSYHMNARQKIYLVFATNKKTEKKMKLKWNFVEDVFIEQESKVIDNRDDDFAPTLSFTVRDSETKQPLIASLVLQGNRDLEGMYIGSDFFFNITSSRDMMISCDLEGYFYFDSLLELNGFEDTAVEIELVKATSGKSLQIEDIQFVPGTSEILQSSEPKLRRLKDFLALNADLEVEIQGHVFAMGDNSLVGQKISEARAKRVLKYLVDNGIDKHRLDAVGYGNTRPIHPNPIRSHQEQANRRVEILIK
jgi:flagellar motor protein MotB